MQVYQKTIKQAFKKQLPINSTDLQACKFFQSCKQQLINLTKNHQFQQHLKKTQKKLSLLANQSQKNNLVQDKMLFNNLVVDYLRSYNLNYTYAIFMRQQNIIAQEIVGKKKLADLIGVEEKYATNDRFNISLLELMVKQLMANLTKLNFQNECGVQTQMVMNTVYQNSSLLTQNRIRQVREQVQTRQKFYYQRKLQSIRAQQIMQLRHQIQKQYEHKLKLQQQKWNKKYQQLVQKSKNYSITSSLKQQNNQLINLNYQLNQQINKVKFENQQLIKNQIKHHCQQSQCYQKLRQMLEQQKKQLSIKKQQFNYALLNLNTKVQDLVLQKTKINSQKQTDLFMKEIKINKQNKDYMIQTIYSQMKQMGNRNKVLSQQNKQLKLVIKQLKLNLKYQQQKNISLKEQSFINAIQGNIDLIPFETQNQKSISSIEKKSYGHSERVINQNCEQCKIRYQKKNVFKPMMINVCVDVKQQDLKIMEEIETDDDYEERMMKDLQHKEKLAKLKTMRNILKNQTLMFVQNDL